ncbi:MAG: O-antigen ligase family protein [Chloroherpetonaceae bacterium]|nr:O-antigen ligase family protein [Chloroherpetonaceae bacterium]
MRDVICRTVLLTTIFTIPLQQLLYLSVAGITVKTYQVLLAVLGVLSFFQVRESQALSEWQKIGLAFFLVSVSAELAGYIELRNFGSLPELKYIGSVETHRFTLNLYLLLNMLFAWQVVRFITEVPEGLRTILTTAALGSLLPSLYALYQLFSFVFGFEIEALEFGRIIDRPEAPRGIFFDSGTVRFASTYFEPGPFGGYLSIIIPLTVLAIKQWQSDAKEHLAIKWVLKAILLLNIVALLLSFSTSALVGMMLFALIVTGLTYPLGKVLKGVATALLAVAAMVTLLGQWEFVLNTVDVAFLRKLFAEETDVYAISRIARIHQAEVGLKIFLDHPIVGIGPFVPFFFEVYEPSTDGMPQAVSIVYVNVLTQTGLVGGALFFYAIGKLMIKLVRAVRLSNRIVKANSAVLLGLFAAVLTLFFTLGSLVAVHLWLAVGVIVGWLMLHDIASSATSEETLTDAE